MQKVGIVTDSTSDIPPQLAAHLDIEVVPLRVYFGRLEFRDGVDLSADEFYARLLESDAQTATSMPAPTEFMEVYARLGERYSSIISLHLSADLSGTPGAAQMAARQLPEMDIRVVDSRTVSIGLLAQVLAAARAARAGAEIDEALEAVEHVRRSTEIYIVLDSLEYLEKGGRIGAAAAFVGGLLGVKPVLTVKDGVIFPWARVRTKKKAFRRITEAIEARRAADPQARLWVAVGHGARDDDAAELARAIQDRFQPQELIQTQVGPTLGVHAGPGVDVAAFFLE